MIESIHGGRDRWGFLPISKAIGGSWKAIVSFLSKLRLQGTSLHSCIRGKVGNGSVIRFWTDHWFGSSILKDRWPAMYRLEQNKNCTIGERFVFASGRMSFNPKWKRWPQTVVELSEMQELSGVLSNFSYAEHEDRWQWVDADLEEFSVAQVKRLIRKGRDINRPHVMSWDSWVPVKVNLLMWRAEMDRLPTRIALKRRGVDIQDFGCVLCNAADESMEHIFTGCGFSFGVWSMIGSWCKIGPVYAFDFSDILRLHEIASTSKWGKRIIKCIVMIACWAIWRSRNTTVFEGGTSKVIEVVSNTKFLAFLWLSSRSRFRALRWKDWVVNPLYML